MAYVPNAADASQPTGDKSVASAAPEFRAVKSYLGSIDSLVLSFSAQLAAILAGIGAGDNSAALAANLASSTGGQYVGFIGLGSNVVYRTILDKSRDIRSVFDYMTPVQIASVRARDLAQDVTIAIQNAIDDIGDGVLFCPDGAYKTSGQLVAPLNKTPLLLGRGYASCGIFLNSVTEGCLKFQTVNPGGGIIGIALANTVGGAVPGSSGIGLDMQACGNNFVVRDVLITNYDTGVRVQGSNGELFSNVTVRYFSTVGIEFPAAPSQLEGRYENIQISNVGFSAPGASIGLSIKNSGGHFFNDWDILACNNGVVIKPPALNQVSYCKFNNVLADTCLNDAWVVDGTDGTVLGSEATGCWGAFSTGGSGLVTKGGNLLSFQWNGGRLRENGKHGWHHQGGNNVSVMNAHIAQNSKLATLTYDGVHIDANASGWQLEGCRVGNFASSLGTQCLNCLNIVGGTSTNFEVVGNTFIAPGAGGSYVVNGSTGFDWHVESNLPRRTRNVNASTKQVQSFTSLGNVTAGSNSFLGSFGQATSPEAASYVFSDGRLVTGFYAAVVAAPGAAQSFTYVVYKNGVATSLTGSIAGAASFTVFVSTIGMDFLVGPTDYITMRVTTSAGAAATIHYGYIQFDK